jgi:hypothetical protein
VEAVLVNAFAVLKPAQEAIFIFQNSFYLETNFNFGITNYF